MNPGQPINTVIQDILAQKALKRDFVAPTSVIEFDPNLQVNLGSSGIFQTNDLFHDQMATHLNIPKKFYDRLRAQHPDLIALNANRLLKDKPEQRLVRTMDGTARAFLSDKYRRLDNDDIAAFMLPIMQSNTAGLHMESAFVNEKKLYFQLVSDKVQGELRVGQTVQAGVIVQNSEVGLGALSIRPLLYTLACRNGAIIQQFSKRHTHLGSQLTFDADYEIMSNETIHASNQALMLQVRDYLSYVVSQDGFNTMIDSIKETADEEIKADPQQVIEVLAEREMFSEEEKKNILYSFLKGNDFTRWGLSSAITATANEHPNYDRVIELETFGGKIMTMPSRDFLHIAKAV